MRIPEKTILVTETTNGMAEDGFVKQPRHRALRMGQAFAGRDSLQINPNGFFVR